MLALRTALFALAWIVVFSAAAYDAGYAWQFQASFSQWEMNPFAVWTAREFGLPVLLAVKLSGLAFAGGLAWYCKTRQLWLERPITVAASCAYAVLLIYYLFVQPQHHSQAELFCMRY